MLTGFFKNLHSNLGTRNFSIVYGLIFSVLISAIALGVSLIMDNQVMTSSRLVMDLIMYFVIGVFVARQMVKRF